MMLSVAICTYNREKYLPQLFESIIRQTLPPENFEIILVNNNSTDRTEEICAEFHKNNPGFRYHYCIERQQGLSFSRNRAIEEAEGDIVVFLDDDAHAQEDYFELLVKRFAENPSLSAIGGKILLDYETIVPSWENKYLNSLLGYYNPGDKPFFYRNSDYPRGSNMAFRMQVFREIGMFNVKLGRIGRNLLGGEEKDLFLRIYRQQGYQVSYDPSLVVFHCVPPERTTKAFIERQAFQTGMSERTRSLHHGKGVYLLRLLDEMYKWGASLVLFFIFWLRGKKTKGNMIIIFRIWVTKGLIGISSDKNVK